MTNFQEEEKEEEEEGEKDSMHIPKFLSYS